MPDGLRGNVGPMAAPRFAPAPVLAPDAPYASPDVVPESWVAERPGDLDGRQPLGAGLGWPGPDQGYALKLAARLRPELVLTAGEHGADVIAGCVGIAMRRAALYGRAPIIHDVRMAFTMWGYLDSAAPAELVERRRALFATVGEPAHYAERRAIADSIPEATLRMTPAEVAAASPRDWRRLVGSV